MKRRFFEELKALKTEYDFNARWLEIEKYHDLGRILCEYKVSLKELSKVVQKSGEDIEDLECAILFYKTYPDLDMFPSGKNMTWHRLKTILTLDK